MAGITRPIFRNQSLHFVNHLRNGCETSIGPHNYYSILQHVGTLEEELEEGNLTSLHSEFTESLHLDGGPDAFDGTGLLQELEVDLASDFVSFSRLQIAQVSSLTSMMSLRLIVPEV